jgi:phosphomevalonate kinase
MEETTIIFLLGLAGTGKDTIGLHFIKNGFIRVASADAVKEKVADLHNLNIKDLMEQGPIKEAYRKEMIHISETARKKDPICWLKKAFNQHIEEETGVFKKGKLLVVTDCRRDAEIDWVCENKERYFALKYNVSAGFSSVDDTSFATVEINKVIHKVTVRKEYIPNILPRILLFEVKRNGIEDPDILTHYCLGYAKGLHRATKNYQVIDGVIDNSCSKPDLQKKLNSLLKEIFI